MEASGTRARLTAPAPEVWRRGEQLWRDERVRKILLERELRIGCSRKDCDIVLPGNFDPFSESLQEYVPMLFQAIELDRSASLRRLLEAGVDANSYFLGKTPLGVAAAIGRTETVRILHSHGASLDLPWVCKAGKAELAPLHAAAAGGHTSVVRYLLDHLAGNDNRGGSPADYELIVGSGPRRGRPADAAATPAPYC